MVDPLNHIIGLIYRNPQTAGASSPSDQGPSAGGLRSRIDALVATVFDHLRQFGPFSLFGTQKNGEMETLEPEASKFVTIKLEKDQTVIYNRLTDKFTLISPAPPIRNLAISGGGAKGVILPGVIQAFEDHKTPEGNFREQLENISGSSIGAVTASLIAAGMPAKRLVDVSRNTDFKMLLGKGIGPVRLDGKPLVNFIRTHLKDSIRNNLRDIFGLEDLRLLTEVQVAAKIVHLEGRDSKAIIQGTLEAAREVCKEGIDDVCITFSMLHKLHQLEPRIFKDLVVTATCKDNGRLCYFDAERTPNLDIAIGCRASGSLPIVLSPVEIDRESLSPGYKDLFPGRKTIRFVDGGYVDNIPVLALEDKQTGANGRGEYGQNLQTLALVFDTTDRGEDEQSPFFDVKIHEHAIFNPRSWIERLLRDVLAARLGNIKVHEKNTLTTAKGYEEIRVKYAQRNIPLLISLTAVDFKEAKKNEEFYKMRGYTQAADYLQLHQNEMIYRMFDTIDELLEAIR